MNVPSRDQPAGVLSLDPDLMRDAAQEKPSRAETLPLSFAQQRLWLLDQLNPQSPVYNVPLALRLQGPLDPAVLRSAMQRIIDRHEVLRTQFGAESGRPFQRVIRSVQFNLDSSDLTRLQEARRAETIHEQMVAEARRPFDLQKDLLVRGRLWRAAPDDHFFLLTIHHIAADEWSLDILLRELQALYPALTAETEVWLDPLPIQYADFALWQREWFEKGALDQQIAYWENKLAAPLPTLTFPLDQSRPPIQTHEGATETLALSKEFSVRIQDACRREGTTQFMFLLAAFEIVLHRYTGQADFLVGAPVAGRPRAETENLIGFFVNTLVLRADAAGNPTVREMLQRVRETNLAALAHAEVPFEKLVEILHPERSAAFMPMIQTAFSVENQLDARFQLGPVQAELIDLDTGTAKFDMTCVAQQRPEGFRLLAEYDRRLFFPGTIQRFLRHMRVVLEGMVEQPDLPIGRLPLLTAEERQQVLVEWNKTETPFPADAPLQVLFETQAERSPQAVAATFEHASLTYAELNARSNQLAHHLRDLGVDRGKIAALCVERSIDMVVALLAIIKAGAAYLPLDPSYPRDRIALMIEDARAAILITQEKVWNGLEQSPGLSVGLPSHDSEELAHPSFPDIPIVRLDHDAALIAACSTANLPCGATTADPAYVIYTSGSTGKPKGTAIPQRAINRLVLRTNYIALDATDRIAQASNVSFDAATFEIWGALLNGAQLVGIQKDLALSPKEFAAHLAEHGITTLFLTTALFNLMAAEAPEAFKTLRNVLFGGEKVDPKSVRNVLKTGPPKRLLHVYGPTETTTFATWHLISHVAEDAMTVPIGRPISNTEVYLLDPELQPAPIGVPGEIYIGGPGLASGYLNREELTRERFVPHPFRNDPGARLYRTGDIGRFLPDGSIDFVGRRDQQLKIRGFRIEPGEIESVLSAHPALQEAVVIAREDEPGQKKLAAYWIAKKEIKPPTVKELRRFVQQKLPEFMVPAFFVEVDSFPLTPNKKINTAALPKPDQSLFGFESAAEKPAGVIETALAEVWQNLLGILRVHRSDNFFELGGHSLLAVRLFAEIQKRFGKQLPLATLFQAPTLEQLAAIIGRRTPPADSLLVELQGEGNQPPIFWIHSLGGDGGGAFFYYRQLAQLLGPDRPSYGVRSPETPLSNIEQMAKRYLQELRSIQPEGPYYLGGFCFGGVVAFEMARQLAARNEKIAALVLLESAPPNSPFRPDRWNRHYLSGFVQNLAYWSADLFKQKPGALRKRFSRKLKITARQIRSRVLKSDGEAAVDLRDMINMADYPKAYVRYAEAHWEALRQYQPQPYAGEIILFRARKQGLLSFDPNLGWKPFAAGGVRTFVVPGSHDNMLKDPLVQIVAEKLNACLSRRT